MSYQIVGVAYCKVKIALIFLYLFIILFVGQRTVVESTEKPERRQRRMCCSKLRVATYSLR